MPRTRPLRAQAREALALKWLRAQDCLDALVDELVALRDAGALEESEAKRALLSATQAADELTTNRPRLSLCDSAK